MLFLVSLLGREVFSQSSKSVAGWAFKLVKRGPQCTFEWTAIVRDPPPPRRERRSSPGSREGSAMQPAPQKTSVVENESAI